MRYETKVAINNADAELFTFFVEPWGDDFWLEKDEAVTLHLWSEEDVPRVSLVHRPEGLQVYVDGPRDTNWSVFRDDQELDCGHRRDGGPARFR